MKVLWAIICQSSAVDQETNNVSLFNLLEQVHVPEPPTGGEANEPFPVAPISFSIVALLSRTNLSMGESGKGRIRIEFPSDAAPDLLPDFEYDLEVALHHRIRFHFQGMPIKGEGIYRFLIEEEAASGQWTQLFEAPLIVSYQDR